MKLFALIFLIFSFASCSDNRTETETNQEIPKALDDNKSSYKISSKRGSSDLIESLYNDLVHEDTDLKNLENKINELNKSKRDTTYLFDNYNSKNQSYFTSADIHVLEIKDSVLLHKVRDLVALQLSKYTTQIEKHKELLKVIEANQTTISDLQNVLKIVRTLPIIDKYQRDNLPSTKSLEGYIKQQEETIQLAEIVSKK